LGKTERASKIKPEVRGPVIKCKFRPLLAEAKLVITHPT